MIDNIIWFIGLITSLLILSWIFIYFQLVILVLSYIFSYKLYIFVENKWLSNKFYWLMSMYNNLVDEYAKKMAPIMEYHPIERAIHGKC